VRRLRVKCSRTRSTTQLDVGGGASPARDSSSLSTTQTQTSPDPTRSDSFRPTHSPFFLFPFSKSRVQKAVRVQQRWRRRRRQHLIINSSSRNSRSARVSECCDGSYSSCSSSSSRMSVAAAVVVVVAGEKRKEGKSIHWANGGRRQTSTLRRVASRRVTSLIRHQTHH
jgi:hypothetical protein